MRTPARSHSPRAFFDAIVSIDAFVYFGTDDLYLPNVARHLKHGGALGIAGAGLMQEIDGPLPDHLARWWEPSHWCLHSAGWWKRHWERTGIVDVELADTMPDGWEVWLEWQRAVSPDNSVEIEALETDAGRFLGYIRALARRTELELEEPIVSIPPLYERKPLLRDLTG